MSNALVMYVGWECVENYDMTMVDWKCITDASSTLWATHQFAGGYNCFLCDNSGDHKLLLSKWNGESAGQKAEIEYISPLSNPDDLDFDTEGTGKHVYTEYPWENNKWYSLCLGIKNMYGKTFYAQWVREGSDTPWILTGVISVPGIDGFVWAFAPFQEDYAQTEADREFQLKNAFGRSQATGLWTNWRNYEVTNAYYSYDPFSRQDNYPHKCDWGISNDHVWIKTGVNVSPGTKTLPYNLQLPASSPVSPPVWFNYCLPRTIKSRHSNLYVSYDPNTNKVVQQNTPTYWNFVDDENGYFYIMIDNTKVITFDQYIDGADLYVTNKNPNNDNQKWQKKSLSGQGFYFVPKAGIISQVTRAIEIENSQTTPAAQLQIFTYYDNEPRYQWDVTSCVQRKTIKSKYSGLYLTPTSNNGVVQTNEKYVWNIVFTNDGKFYILTQDNAMAVTVTNYYDGADLQMASFDPLANQAWSTMDTANSYFRIVPEGNPTFTMDVEGPSSQENIPIQIWTYGVTVNQVLWTFENPVTI